MRDQQRKSPLNYRPQRRAGSFRYLREKVWPNDGCVQASDPGDFAETLRRNPLPLSNSSTRDTEVTGERCKGRDRFADGIHSGFADNLRNSLHKDDTFDVGMSS